MEWTELETLLTAEDGAEPEALCEALTRLDDKQRRALSKPLAAFVKQWWIEAEDIVHLNVYSGIDRHQRRRLKNLVANTEALRLAVVGVSGAASAATTWLSKESQWSFTPWVSRSWERVPEVEHRQTRRLNRVLATRSPDWVAKVFTTVAARLRVSGNRPWTDYAVDKVGELRLTPPTTAAFVQCWINRYTRYGVDTYDERLAALRADPLRPRMLDALFTTEGLGWSLEHRTAYDGRVVWRFLDSLMEHGDINRDFLLDGCLRRLLHGGKVGDLRPYRTLLEELEPTPHEVADRVRDLLALLPDTVSTTAGTAQRLLRTCDEAGLLDGETVVEASQAILFRPEKKLARDQLSWLAAAIGRHPDAADDLLAALGTAFGHAATDVATRAVSLVLKHGETLSPRTRDDLAGAAVTLARGERDRLDGFLDIEAVEPEPVTILTTPTRPAPEPITTIAELAERVARLTGMLRTDPQGHDLDSALLEPVLAALVEFAHRDRPALAVALKPVLPESWQLDPEWYRGNWARLLDGVLFAAVRAAGVAEAMTIDADILYGRDVPEERRTPKWSTAASRWRKSLARLTGPERVLALRLVELDLLIVEDPVPRLLATDVDGLGRVDAERLVEALHSAETEGWQPWEFDLQQALLRIPDAVAPRTVAAAETLTSPAGRRLADWLSGRVRPRITVTKRPAVMFNRHGDVTEATLPLAKVAVWQPDSIRDTTVVQLASQLRLSFPQRVNDNELSFHDPDWPRTFVAVLPSRPDVVAAHLARMLGPVALWELTQPMPDRYYLSALTDLAETDGPTDPGLTACLAFGLNVSAIGDRVCVVEALATSAARDRLDPVALADLAAELILSGLGKCTRTATVLRELAEAGAPRQVWEILAAMLPKLLVAEATPHRLSDLMELAARTADTVGVKGEIEAVAAVAARRGSSKLVTEARRLHDCLTG